MLCWAHQRRDGLAIERALCIKDEYTTWDLTFQYNRVSEFVIRFPLKRKRNKKKLKTKCVQPFFKIFLV